MSAKPRVVIIGLDSLDVRLARRWAAEGILPCFRRLFAASHQGLVENPLGLEAGGAWPSFAYGLPPDVHAQFDGAEMFDSATYEMRRRGLNERLAEPFWVTASRAGKRVAIVDFPYAFLETELNGIQIADWLTHVRIADEMPVTFPPKLAAAVTSTYGRNPFPLDEPCPTDRLPLETAAAVVEFRDQLVDRARRKTALSEALLAQERWDLFMTVFHDAHDIGHRCWHIHDTAHERHDEAMAAIVGDPVRDVYVALDASLERLLRASGDDATILVYVSHGMGPERTGSFLLDDILGALEKAYRGPQAPPPPAQRSAVGALYRTLVPAMTRRWIARTPLRRRAYRADEVERLRSRRFFECSPNFATGGVRVNVQGRERHGLVAPGELDELCRRLFRDLLQVVNEDTGEPIISSVTRTREIYKGPNADQLPDLLLEWDKRAPITRVHSPLIGRLERRRPRLRTGDHLEKTGSFFALGPGIQASLVRESVSVVDFAPTIAAILGYGHPRYTGTVVGRLMGRRLKTA